MRASAGERFITILGELEVVNALGLRTYQKRITTVQAQSSLSDFEKDLHGGFSNYEDCLTLSLTVRANYRDKPRPNLARAQLTYCT